MVTSAEFRAIHHFRDEALDCSELHAISPTGDLFPRVENLTEAQYRGQFERL
jgi:hypothetical protein